MASEPRLDPYRPPPSIDGRYLRPGQVARPGWFITICVIAIALGGLGLFHALFSIADLTIGDPLELLVDTEAASDELVSEFENAVRDVQIRFLPALLPLELARLALTVCLIVGGIWSLQGKPLGRTLLAGTFAAALLFELCDSVVQAFVAQEMGEPFRAFGQALDAQQAPQTEGPALWEMVLAVALWGITCVYYLCQATKFLYYLLGLLYLRRPALDPLFAPQAQLAEDATAA